MPPVIMVLHRGLEKSDTLKGIGYSTASRCSDHRGVLLSTTLLAWARYRGFETACRVGRGLCALPASDAELYEIEFHSSLTS